MIKRFSAFRSSAALVKLNDPIITISRTTDSSGFDIASTFYLLAFNHFFLSILLIFITSCPWEATAGGGAELPRSESSSLHTNP